jgi:uncharacterized membrane protein YqjE
MPIGPQPKGARGTVGHPYSALNLRLVLAAFGLVSCTALAVLLIWMGYRPAAALLGLFAVVALVDLVVIQFRRRARRRIEDGHHSLFE